MALPPYIAARHIARRRGIPLVATFHSKYYDDVLKATHSRLLAWLGVKYILSFYNSCDEVWAVNESTGQVLREYGYKGPMAVMPMLPPVCVRSASTLTAMHLFTSPLAST